MGVLFTGKTKRMSCYEKIFIIIHVVTFDFPKYVFPIKISNLGAERFIQMYNDSTYNEHGNMNYFVKPENVTPAHWGTTFQYSLWRSKSIDSKYTLELTANKQGYVSKIEITCAFKSDINNAVGLLTKMLQTSSFLTVSQVNYLIKSIKKYDGYYRGDIVVNNQTAAVLLHRTGSLAVSALGVSPYD